jgi:hypothetical protein
MSSTSGRTRILQTLHGEAPDRVPFVPNIWQWFHLNRLRGTLPAELERLEDPVDVLRSMGADVLSKFDGVVLRETLSACRRVTTYEGEVPEGQTIWTSWGDFRGGNVRREHIETSAGVLTHAWRYESEAGAPFETEHWWTDFDREYPAVKAWMEDADWRADRDALQRGLDKVGDDGLVLLQTLPTPLKQLHWLAGPEHATLFVLDHPQEMRELARIHEAKALTALERVVDEPGIWAFEVPDNLDALFYSPPLFREFCLPMLRTMARVVHARGKYLFVHACGKLKALAPLILESEIDCVEGQAHAPIGDWSLPEARALSDRLILCGGMTAREQEWTGGDGRRRIFTHVRQLFASVGDRRRFLFASACNTSPATPYENLLAFRDAAREHGEVLRPSRTKTWR